MSWAFALVVLTTSMLFNCAVALASESYTSQVAAKPVFISPLEWIGDQAPPESESQALLQTISTFESRGPKAGIAALENFLSSYPNSAWAPSLRVNMAEWYRTSGRYTLALGHWEQAWEKTKNSKQPAGQQLAARAIAGWTRLLASLGLKDKISSLFAELDALQLPLGTYGTTIEGTRDGLAMMKFMPGASYRCGSYALGHVAKSLNLKLKLDDLFEAKSPDGGFHLSELLDLAQSNKIPVQAVRRPPGGAIVVPSVIHWKLNHYAAIVDQKDDYYKVMDPTFGGHAWIDAETIDAEASGAVLAPKDRIPAGWQQISATECASIYGKGYPNTVPDGEDPGSDDCDPSDSDDSSCDNPSSNDGAGGDGSPPPPEPPLCGCGTPTWKISEPYNTLWLQDIPLLYRLSNGRWMKLELRYKHRGEYRGANLPSFGDKWECSWLGAMFKSSSITDTYTNHMIGGGILPFNTNGVREYWTGRTLILDAGPSTPAVVGPTGAENAYRTSLVVLSGLTAYPLTHKIDRFGRTTLYNYTAAGNAMLLSTVTDIDGQNCTLTYTNRGSVSNLIASVTDPYGRTARFYYDATGRLTNITDVIGLSTYFQYDTSDNITNMVTPYGTTSFRFLTGNSTNVNYLGALRRAVVITEPSGDHQLYAYCDKGPAGVAADSFPQLRNSYHWNRAQYNTISAQGLANVLDMQDSDYTKGETSHWLHGLNDSGGNMTVTATRNAKAGTTDSGGNRPATSFTYQGQTSPAQIGTLRRVASATSPLFDNIAITRNILGRPTNTVYINSDPISGNMYSGYTNAYDSGGMRLLKQTGPHGELVRRYGYHPTITNLLTSVTNVLGEVISYTYDTTLLKPTSISFPSGLVRSNAYYSSGQNKGFLLSTMDTGFRTNSYSYLNGNMASQTNELGLVTTYLWDNLNRLISTTFPDGTTISNVYNKLDLVAAKDRLNQWTYFGYNSLRQRVAETNVNGQVTQYTYCSCGSPSQISRWNNGTTVNTQFNYDSDGRLTNVVYADGYQINYGFNYQGLLTTIGDSSGRQMLLNYAQIGSQLKISTAYLDIGQGALFLKQIFDEYGRVTNSIDRNGVTVASSYDLLDRLTNRIVVSTAPVPPGPEKFVYNSRGLTNYFDQLGHLTVFVRDGLGRVLSQTNANNEALQFAYNPSDEITSLIDGKNQTTSWKYDIYGRVTNKVNALGTNAFIYAYDANDRLTNRTSAAKGTTRYIYDPAGNLTNVVYPVSSSLAFKYDGLNRLTNMVDAIGSTIFTWTPGDQLASEAGPWADDTVSYTYTNRLLAGLSLLQPNASPWVQGYGYDTIWRLNSLTSPAGTFGYNYQSGSSELVNKLDYPTGASSYRSFDDVGRLTSVYLSTPTSGVVDQYSYYFDQASQRTQQVFTAGNYANYTYDNIGQLKTAKGFESGGVTARLHEQFGYSYDKAWNLANRTNNALVQTFNANSANELTSIGRSGTLTVAGFAEASATPSVTVSGTGLASGAATVYADGSWARAGANPANGGNTYTASATDSYGRSSQDTVAVNLATTVSLSYDSNGNLLSDGQRYFSYDDENQLTSVTVSNTWLSQFTYDALMRRRVRREYIPSTTDYITNQTLGTLRNDFQGLVGMQIVVGANPITVTALGRMLATNSNHQSHTIKLVNAIDGTDVPGGSVSVLMNGSGTVGQYQYMALSAPVVLAAGAAYYVVSQEWTNAGDYWFHDDTTVTTTSAANVTTAIFNRGDGVWHTDATPNHSYVPVNFKYYSSGAGSADYIVNQTLGTLRNDFQGLVGMQIVVGPNPITVTALGRMLATNSNHQSHTIKLVNASDGSDVPGGSVSVLMNGSGTVGQYQYMALSGPVVLAAGATYYVVSQEWTNAGDYWFHDDTTVTTTSAANVTTAIFNRGDGVWHTDATPNHSYVPVNFKYSAGWVQAGETHYIYDGKLVAQERDANNLPTVTYTRGLDLSGTLQGAGGIGGLLTRTDAGLLTVGSSAAHAYYHADGNGNVTALFNSTQPLVAKYVYDPFGNILSQSGPLADANLYRFSSKEFHKNSGSLYYLYRFYDANLQRWLNRDPVEEEGGLNLYAFCANSPGGKVDDYGLECRRGLDALWDYPSEPHMQKPDPFPAPTSPRPGPERWWDPRVGQWAFDKEIASDDAPWALLIPLFRSPGPKLGLDVGQGGWQMANRVLSDTISKQQRDLLRQLFGTGAKGARDALAKLEAGGKLPEGLTRETLETYKKIAQNTIAGGADGAGAQAARVSLIDKALRQCTN